MASKIGIPQPDAGLRVLEPPTPEMEMRSTNTVSCLASKEKIDCNTIVLNFLSDQGASPRKEHGTSTPFSALRYS